MNYIVGNILQIVHLNTCRPILNSRDKNRWIGYILTYLEKFIELV
jgi:hypothetical protein